MHVKTDTNLIPFSWNTHLLLNKRRLFVLLSVVCILQAIAFAQSDINKKMDQLNVKTAGLKELIDIFGEPEAYKKNWKPISKDNLPNQYNVCYPDGLTFYMIHDRIGDIAIREPCQYRYREVMGIGSTLETALKVMGEPSKIIENQPSPKCRENGVLYKDIGGTQGHCSYKREDQNIQVFFYKYRITSIHFSFPQKIYKPDIHITELDKVEPYYPVGSSDIRKIRNLDLQTMKTLSFDVYTLWPTSEEGAVTYKWYADQLMDLAKNPGLGIRRMHKAGITGKGVHVAIIDQPLTTKHPEYNGKIIAYYDTGCKLEISYQGPAVTSLLVGETCGTAPDAKVFYAAIPKWTDNIDIYRKAVDWILEKNRALPADQKIRVISVSTSSFGGHPLNNKNIPEWDQICREAESEGIMVLDPTFNRRFIEKAFFRGSYRENPAAVEINSYFDRVHEVPSDKIFVPCGPRTMAHEKIKGAYTYCYSGQGDRNWTIPYVAGVLAMGWQVRPEATPEQLKDMLFQSAYISKEGAKIINPQKFILSLRRSRVKNYGLTPVAF